MIVIVIKRLTILYSSATPLDAKMGQWVQQFDAALLHSLLLYASDKGMPLQIGLQRQKEFTLTTDNGIPR